MTIILFTVKERSTDIFLFVIVALTCWESPGPILHLFSIRPKNYSKRIRISQRREKKLVIRNLLWKIFRSYCVREGAKFMKEEARGLSTSFLSFFFTVSSLDFDGIAVFCFDIFGKVQNESAPSPSTFWQPEFKQAWRNFLSSSPFAVIAHLLLFSFNWRASVAVYEVLSKLCACIERVLFWRLILV